MKFLKKILISLKIIQMVSNEERRKNGLKRLGRGHLYAYRLNPCNPLSYVLFVFITTITLILYGVVGLIEKGNLFKWD